MIIGLISDIFSKVGRLWKVSGELITPSEEDIEKLLDEAAVKLFAEPVGTRFETGGLIVEKRNRSHDVYVMVGSYQ
jgi:hypothetical protein